MDYLPLFIKLHHRPVLVVGGGEVAERKIALLQQAGAEVRVVAQTLTITLYRAHQQGELQWINTTFCPTQLAEVVLVIAATDDPQLNEQVSQAANARQLLVNVVDDPRHCSCVFPAIIDRSPLMIAISSAGRAPVLARLIRERLEALLPVSLGIMARLAGGWRQAVRQRLRRPAQRRDFWRRLFSSRFVSLVEQGQPEAAEQQLAELLASYVSADSAAAGSASANGEVILVGAGPGDVGLLTLKGLQAIQQADVVLYDHLVSDDVLALIRRDAQQLYVGKQAGRHAMTQEAISQRLILLAQQGQRIVRLKGGDPLIFGRGGEELTALAAAGIPFQVVPGVTAAAGAAAYAGIPLTHRDYAHNVLLVTGHDKSASLDWPLLAQQRQTLAIYMGAMNAAQIQQQLLRHGRSPNTPVAVISRGTCADQQVQVATLAELQQLASQAASPSLLIIGEVASLHQQLAWFGRSSSTWSPLVNLA